LSNCPRGAHDSEYPAQTQAWQLIKELKQSVAIKVNNGLPQDPALTNPKQNGNPVKRRLVTQKIPPRVEPEEEEVPDFLAIHRPPERNSL
jgi:hypothetical protein